MSTRERVSEPAKTARLLGACVLLYFVAHLIWAHHSDVPTESTFAKIDERGLVSLQDNAPLDWYLTGEQLADFDMKRVRERNVRISSLSGSVLSRIAVYSKSTAQSNGENVSLLENDIANGNFTDAKVRWSEVASATSPKTLASFGASNDSEVTRELTELEQLEVEQRGSLFLLQPDAQPGFLWTTPTAARFEILSIASLAALASLLFRRRSLRKRKFNPESAPLSHTLSYAIGPLLALLVWSLVRPEIEFSRYSQFLVLLGIGIGFGFPFVGRALAEMLGFDPTMKLQRTGSSVRQGRILAAMKDLRPNSFEELKQAASQLAAELVSAEVEERPQS